MKTCENSEFVYCLFFCYLFQSREVTRLMACLGYVLSTVPVEQCMQCLNIILPPHMNQLQALGATQVSYHMITTIPMGYIDT